MPIVKIADMAMNASGTYTLVVDSVAARQTRALKPYLALGLTDGTDKIFGNYWDWTSGAAPEKGSVVDVDAQVTEWNGAKQLRIKGMRLNTTVKASEFEPPERFDISTTYKDAYALAGNINDDYLRGLTLGLLERYIEAWHVAPGAKRIHHAFKGGALMHTVSVANIAAAMADQVPAANKDLCVAGALLHDVGKLFAYYYNGASCDMTFAGTLLDHIVLGDQVICAETCPQNEAEANKLLLLRHIIASHHGRKEYGSPVEPVCLEAYIVNTADQLDAMAQQCAEAFEKTPEYSHYTAKIPGTGRPMLNSAWVQNLFCDD